MAKELDARETLFVSEYLVDLDPKRAALAAGYSPSMAASKAFQWVSNSKSTKPHLFAAIQAAQRKRIEQTDITANRVLKEVEHIAFADLSQAFEYAADGSATLRRLCDMPEGIRRSIEAVREQPTDKGVMRTVKLHSKIAALKMLADHLGLEAPKKHMLSGDQDKPIAIKGVNSLTREQTLEITAKILGVAKQLVDRKFGGAPTSEKAPVDAPREPAHE